MKIRIEVDPQFTQEEVIIKVQSVHEEVYKIQEAIQEIINQKSMMVLYKKDCEYFKKVEDLLFFESADTMIYAHTQEEAYQVKLKLYELEAILPKSFVRISKSTIVNCRKITSLTRTIGTSQLVEFQDTYKKVYVSRHYYKLLKNKLMEMR